MKEPHKPPSDIPRPPLDHPRHRLTIRPCLAGLHARRGFGQGRNACRSAKTPSTSWTCPSRSPKAIAPPTKRPTLSHAATRMGFADSAGMRLDVRQGPHNSSVSGSRATGAAADEGISRPTCSPCLSPNRRLTIPQALIGRLASFKTPTSGPARFHGRRILRQKPVPWNLQSLPSDAR